MHFAGAPANFIRETGSGEAISPDSQVLVFAAHSRCTTARLLADSNPRYEYT